VETEEVDVAIVGAGAAGLAAAIFAARANAACRIALLDGAKRIGAKILVSGGGRCNITNVRVTADAFWGGSRNTIRNILRAFPETRAAEFFRDIGVPLHEEEWGKLFPDSNQARTVLDALLGEAGRRGVSILADHRVAAVRRGFEVETSQGRLKAARVVLATGGMSIPKTGSDGAGYRLAQSLGHTVIPPTPALAPLVLEGDFHVALSGVSHEVEISLRVAGGKPERIKGPMLWTHFGISGPAAMDASRVWHRAVLEKKPVDVTADLAPGVDVEAKLLALSKEKPMTLAANAIAGLVPSKIAERLAPPVKMAHLSKDQRRAMVDALTRLPLRVKESRGWNFAEVTAGGVPLDEIDPRTMESRLCPGLYFAGEILDADGRIGGYNFQWAWSTGFVAGGAVARTT